jgi:polyphenol oxidase
MEHAPPSQFAVLPYYQPLDLPWLDARFYTAVGGVSGGSYKTRSGRLGLNCAIGGPDAQEAKRKNRQLIAADFRVAARNLLTPTQETSEITIVGNRWLAGQRPAGNSMVVMGNNDRVLGVLTADCAPVIFADRYRRIAAIAHVGWKQAIDNVMEDTMNIMEEFGANRKDLVAAIGPCVGVEDTCFVGKDFPSLLAQRDPQIKNFFKQVGDATVFRFENYLKFRLRRYGVGEIVSTGIDTYSNPDCYSRRCGTPPSGLMFSGIKLRNG